MRTNIFIGLVIIMIILISGCATTGGPRGLRITYKSIPSGAMIIENGGKNHGPSPVTLYYNIDQAYLNNNNNILRTTGMTAYWRDGTSQSVEHLDCNLNLGYNQEYTFKASPSSNYYPTQQSGYGDQGCMRAKQDYIQAEQAYNNAKAVRDSRTNESDFARIGALGRGPGALLMGIFANTTRNASNTAQEDMNHALQLMQDAKGRMSILCRD
jgi:hypothetical protein